MKDGFIRVAALSPELKVADVRYNTGACIISAKEAAEAGAKVAVFPRLSLTSAGVGDLFYDGVLLSAAKRGLCEYAEAMKDFDIISVIGLPVTVLGALYSAAAVVYRGKILGLVPEAAPDLRGAFSGAPEGIYEINIAGQDTLFGTNLIFTADAIDNFRLAVSFFGDAVSSPSPSARLALGGATVIAVPSSSFEIVGASDYRRTAMKFMSARDTAAYILCEAGRGESTSSGVFASHRIVSEGGKIVGEAKAFSDGPLYSTVDVDALAYSRRRAGFARREMDIDGFEYIPFDMQPTACEIGEPISKLPFVPEDEAELNERCELILRIQSEALAARIRRSYAKSVVLGISGGLDSTLALLVAVRAVKLLGESTSMIKSITMPCFGTTARTKGNAERLTEALGATLRIIDIKKSVSQHFADIGHDESDLSVVYENAQARERTQVLMDIANAEGGIVLGTGDLSEVALGWSTYNGDQMSMYNVNAHVPKTLIRYLTEYSAKLAAESKDTEVAEILRDVLATPVSPELLPAKDGDIAQCTEGIVGPYELHDYFLFCHIRLGYSPDKIRRAARVTFKDSYSDEVIDKWLAVFVKRFFTQQFKRTASPDSPRVGSVSLDAKSDYRIPSDVSNAEWLKLL